MEKKLPAELAYLEPVIAKLKTFAPEDLGDDNPDAMDIVEDALKDALKGMSISEAEDKVQKDCDTMQGLLGEPEFAVLGYVYGVMLGMTMYGGIEAVLSAPQ